MRNPGRMEKNNIVITIYKKVDKQKLENCRGSSLLNACYKLYCKILNEELRTQGESFLLECQSGFRKGRSCLHPLFNMKLLVEKRRKFNLETHLAFLDYVEAFDNVEREKCLKY